MKLDPDPAAMRAWSPDRGTAAFAALAALPANTFAADNPPAIRRDADARSVGPPDARKPSTAPPTPGRGTARGGRAQAEAGIRRGRHQASRARSLASRRGPHGLGYISDHWDEIDRAIRAWCGSTTSSVSCASAARSSTERPSISRRAGYQYVSSVMCPGSRRRCRLIPRPASTACTSSTIAGLPHSIACALSAVSGCPARDSRRPSAMSAGMRPGSACGCASRLTTGTKVKAPRMRARRRRR